MCKESVLLSMVEDSNSLTRGQRVYDVETSVYTVVEVLDDFASEVVSREEVTDRGHVIYEEQTVADLNPEYPADDIVVRVQRVNSDREILWPISRVTRDIDMAVEE